MEWYWWVIIIFFALVGINIYSENQRRKHLMEKYGDEALVEKLMKKTIWVGQTAEQLTDSIGKPVDVGQRVLKTKVKETWKYNPTGKNRYGMRITVEDGVVVGWDKK